MAGVSSTPRNIVLIGRTGNGKSATGNSILGKRAFDSKFGANGVTTECQVATSVLENGQTVNVIDTPGFFDLSAQSDFIGDEVIKCVDKVKEGIHAFLLVLSIRTRFSKEEEAVVNNLRTLFGEKVLRFTVVVFTNGDDLEDSESTLEQYLGKGCPVPLKRLISETKNGCAVFNNKTKDKNEKKSQVQKLLSIVDVAIARNNGRPFMDELIDLQARALELRERAAKDAKHAKDLHEQMKKVMQEVEARYKATQVLLERQLADAREAQLRSDKQNREVMEEAKKTIQNLQVRLQDNEVKIQQLEKEQGGGCSIL